MAGQTHIEKNCDIINHTTYITLQDMKTLKNQAKKVSLACDALPSKSMHFCPKHILYQNHRIINANVWVPSIYDDNRR